MRVLRRVVAGLSLLAAAGVAVPALAQQGGGELNLYSSRHYDTHRTLYDPFTRETATRVRLIEGDADQLIGRMRSERADSRADVLITVHDAGLARADAAGVLQPVRAGVLETRIPASL